MDEQVEIDITDRVARVSISKSLLAEVLFPPQTSIIGVNEDDKMYWRSSSIEFGIRHPSLKRVKEFDLSPVIKLQFIKVEGGILIKFPDDAMEDDYVRNQNPRT